MYRVAFSGLGAAKQRVAVTAASPRPGRYGVKTVWEPFYEGTVLTSKPKERTVRFVIDYVAKNFQHVPDMAEARFNGAGEMQDIEVFAPFATGKVAPVKLAPAKIAVPVDVRYGAAAIRQLRFRTANLRESSIALLHAWIASRQHWSGPTYKYAYWKPKKTTVRFSAKTGRPERIDVQVVPGTTGSAGAAKIELEKFHG